MNNSFETIINVKWRKILMQIWLITFFMLFAYIVSLLCSVITNCSSPDLVQRMFMFEKLKSQNLLGVPIISAIFLFLYAIMYSEYKWVRETFETIEMNEMQRNRLIKDYKRSLEIYLYILLAWVLFSTIASLLELTIPVIILYLATLYILSEMFIFTIARTELKEHLREKGLIEEEE
ncbi:MAG: hypothetical protein QXU89_05085 [Desulfurococcaceae archaeon]